MQSFSQFFELKLAKPLLEYRHKDAFGGIKQSIHPDNKKGSNLTIDPLSRKIPWVKGPYKKERKHGETLIGDELTRELGSMNGVEFEDGKEIKRKNSNQILKLFINAHGQPCGRIIEKPMNENYDNKPYPTPKLIKIAWKNRKWFADKGELGQYMLNAKNAEEFKTRLVWLSEGSLRYYMTMFESPYKYGGMPDEHELYIEFANQLPI